MRGAILQYSPLTRRCAPPSPRKRGEGTSVIAVIAVTTALLSVAATRRRATLPPATVPPLDATRSFAVTDLEILDNFFTFPRVLGSLVAGSGTSGSQLIRQTFDMQNPRPGKADSLARRSTRS
jgi:hypothetical protein